ncbi:unnamed protein product [Callosobruchus maculatus]|uniref:Uncharacterized protein n=1 Tax=Callosobruchus maculatus TaxID=64391 RepID=A0A653BXE2_CALMS|nr:unnamed protein product [Callosobruchus maculatus]
MEVVSGRTAHLASFLQGERFVTTRFPIVRFGFTSREGIQDHEFWALATHLHLRGTLHQGLFASLHLYTVSLHRIIFLPSYHLPSIYIWHAHRSSYIFSVKNI